MADIPLPRSYSQILNDLISSFLSRYGIKRLKIGSPLLSILEAAAQSDFRSSQDIFNLLDAQSVDRATGIALDQIAADENITRRQIVPASGFVDFSDTSFNKISTVLYQGGNPPVVGTTVLNISDASSFPSSGSVYIGRGTANYEGPIAYTAKTQLSGYWTLTLSTGTTKVHALTETVVVAQGGNRSIPAGTIVQTSQGSVSTAVSFSTLTSAQIPDGENFLSSVEVVATTAGIIGNVPALSITVVSNNPYAGASVSNPLPFTNGKLSETDDELRERIKKARQSRTKGTSLAITNGIIGVQSQSDGKTVSSASMVENDGKAVVYIDDGTGYEESYTGVAQETLSELAIGGEQLFELTSDKPIAKALLISINTSPFSLKNGDTLSIKVGGVLSIHSFNESDFVSINNATGYEVAASINGNPDISFSARTIGGGNQVVVFAKADVNEDLEIDPSGTANVALLFPTHKVYTLRLFQNNQLLYKDGKSAMVVSRSTADWSNSITSGDTLVISVDGTSAQTITVTNLDFSANTPFLSVNSTNPLSAWATVLNTKIAGATVSAVNDRLQIKSNLGNDARASINIISGTLVSKAMFNAGSDTGLNSDYIFNRFTGQLKLSASLDVNDSLTISTDFSRGYLQSSVFPTGTVTLAGTANLWFAVDGAAKLLSTGVGPGTSLTTSNPYGVVHRYTGYTNMLGTSTAPLLAIGDTVIIWDPQFTIHGTFRIANIDTTNYSWFEVENDTAVTIETKSPLSNGMVFVRSSTPVETVSLSSGTNIPLNTIAALINSTAVGVNASVFRNTYLRIATNSFNNGDIMLVTADLNGQSLLLPVGILESDQPSHYATIESGNPETTMIEFADAVTATGGTNTFTTSSSLSTLGVTGRSLISYVKRLDSTWKSFGNNNKSHQSILNISGNTINLRPSPYINPIEAGDGFISSAAYKFYPDDTLNIILDNDVHKNVNVRLSRKIAPAGGAVYGTTAFSVRDVENSLNSLTDTFGTSTTFFNDYALVMRARGKAYSITANKTMLFRNARYGSEGNSVAVKFINPSAPSLGLSYTTDTLDGNSNINIVLPSGTEKTGLGISGSSMFFENNRTQFNVTRAYINKVATVVTVTLSSTNQLYNHNLKTNDIIYQTNSSNTLLPVGPKKITAVSGNTFQYSEPGADLLSGAGPAYIYNVSLMPAGTVRTVTGLSSNIAGTQVTATMANTDPFNVGDTLYFTPGHYDATSNLTVASGLKTIISKTGTTLVWAETVTASATAVLVSGIPYTISTSACNKVTYNYYKAEAPATTGLTRTGGSLVTVSLNTTQLLPVANFYSIGDIVYLSPGEANFPSGPKIITSVTSSSFTYNEAGSNVSNSNVQYFSSTSTDVNLTGGGTPVIVGDIVHIGSGSNQQKYGDFRVFDVNATGFSILRSYTETIINTYPTKLVSSLNLRFYPINTTASTATLINAYVNANMSSLISSTLVSNNGTLDGTNVAGTVAVDTATEEEFYLTTNNASINGSTSVCVNGFHLFDGVNAVQATSLIVGTSTISLKEAVSAELTSNANFSNEQMYLVPTTVKNLVDFLNTSTISSFGMFGLASASKEGNKLQLATNTIGANGSIQVAGGNANACSASVFGTGSVFYFATLGRITVPTGAIAGFAGNMWVKVQNSLPNTSKMLYGSGVSLTATVISPTESLFTSPSGFNTITPSSATKLQVEKQGNFVGYTVITGGTLDPTVVEGNWILISNGVTLSSNNSGYFRIVRSDGINTFWVENPSAVEQTVTETINFYTFDNSFGSTKPILPGDKIIIESSVFGTTGTFTVSRLDTIPLSTQFYVYGSVTGSLSPVGTEFNNFKIQEGTPARYFKKIKAISPNPLNSSYSDIIFDTEVEVDKISEHVGSVITPLSKLGFDTSLVSGLDGYTINTGLLAEATKVLYGDETNSTVYPGIVAAGADVQLASPLIKRVNVSLSLRLRTGSAITDVIAKVKTSVASAINNTNVGESVAISDIVSAANGIDGVLSVTILYPTYNSTNDLIPIQPNEKAKILDIDTDIQVSILN